MGSSKRRKNSHMPPRVSLRKDHHHDSFFLSFLYISFAALFQLISCLFAKFKDLVVREEHNNTHDSNPKVENEKKDFSKLKDSVVREQDNTDDYNLKATSLTEHQKVFELWCYCYKKTYSDQAEKNMRFGIFQKALSPPPPIPRRERVGNSRYADLTREELDDECRRYYWGGRGRAPDVCYVYPSDLDRTYRNDESWYVQSSESDEEDYWSEECSDDEECWDEDYAQYLRLLEHSSDGTL